MNRRKFLAASGAVGLVPLSGVAMGAGEAQGARDWYELRQYLIDGDDQKKRMDAYFRDAAIPALNRLGVKPVGVFYPEKDANAAELSSKRIYVLLRHSSVESLLGLEQKLLADAEYREKGADFLSSTKGKAAFQRLESSLLLSFRGMPSLETPAKGPERVFQLRIYESPSVATGLKKIEMFNDAGEIKIFRRVGLNPVFFGQSIVGGKMPNLTYMLGFDNMAAQKAGWAGFGKDPDWQRLRKMPEYADNTILSNITNIMLRPADYSQI